jgi:hypothetical protein
MGIEPDGLAQAFGREDDGQHDFVVLVTHGGARYQDGRAASGEVDRGVGKRPNADMGN